MEGLPDPSRQTKEPVAQQDAPDKPEKGPSPEEAETADLPEASIGSLRAHRLVVFLLSSRLLIACR